MAIKRKTKGRTGSFFHLLLRLLGLTGLLVAPVGLVLWSVATRAGAAGLELWTFAPWAGTNPLAEVGRYMVQGGVIAAALALLVEFVLGLRYAAGRRSAFGLNVVVQVALAAVLLVGVNAFSFYNYRRYDCTRERAFTIDANLLDQLRQLQAETTIVVHQTHIPLGGVDEKDKNYDSAAERKVVEKVKDLAEQFQELGPKFKVVVLDVQDEDYTARLAEVAEQAPGLREAIEKTPENSIFFYAGGGKVQRLGFQDIYQLDKRASKEAADGQGNLVLHYQGVGPFARKILNLEEKRPKVAVGVIHEWLSTEGGEEQIGMTGVHKALAEHGIDVKDVLLKKWGEFGPPQPAVFTYDESKYERLEEQLTELNESLKTLDEELTTLNGLVKLWKESSLEDLNKKYADQLKGRQLTEAIRRNQLAVLEQNVALRNLIRDQAREEREAVGKERSGLNVGSIAEQRRISDLKAKTERMLADCDLLILPRLTLLNVARSQRIPNRLHALDEAQIAAVKDFLKAGKPVLFCFGPVNEPLGETNPMTDRPDNLEDELAKLGIKLGKQTVLYNIESKSFAERRSGFVIEGIPVEVPPVEFDWKPGQGQPRKPGEEFADKPHPIRESMLITARSRGKDQSPDVRLRNPRPVYFEPKGKEKPAYDPVILMANVASWNEDNPFPTREKTPRFEPPKSGDPTVGTTDEKRRGPFPLGVAVETTVPAEWYDDKDAKPATVRVAAIGHGGVFVGRDLKPGQEKLLLDTCNWLLGRDDLLAKAAQQWSYPRVTLTATQLALWDWGARLGLPLLFVYLGLAVLLVRRLR